MPRVKRTLESQGLYIRMLEKIAKDFEADLARAKQIYHDLEELELGKGKVGAVPQSRLRTRATTSESSAKVRKPSKPATGLKSSADVSGRVSKRPRQAQAAPAKGRAAKKSNEAVKKGRAKRSG